MFDHSTGVYAEPIRVDLDALAARARDTVVASGLDAHGDSAVESITHEVLATQVWSTSVPAELMSEVEALHVLVAVRRQKAALEAREVELLARAAGPVRSVREVIAVDANTPEAGGSRQRAIELADERREEIAAALRLSPASAYFQIGRARLLTGALPQTLAALADGRISLGHAGALCDQAARMQEGPVGDDPACDDAFIAACHRLEERVLPRAVESTPGQTASRARRAVASIDAAGEAARRQRAKHDLIVDDLGLGPDATIGEIRAAVFMALLRGEHDPLDAPVDAAGEADSSPTDAGTRAHRPAASGVECPTPHGRRRGLRAQASVEVQVMVDAATLTGLDSDGSALVQVGYGEPTMIGRDDLVRLIADPATPTRFRRLVCDPVTGALVDRGARTYAINDDLAAWIDTRDQTCRFPGCTRLARSCDVDHATDFEDGGETTIANTGALCRRQHNAKTHSGWRIEESKPDGSCVFVSPNGFRYVHEPTRLLPEPPDPPDIEAEASEPDPPPPSLPAVRSDEAHPF